MPISYKQLSQKPATFNRLAGMNVEDFEATLEKLTLLWRTGPGGMYLKPELADILMMFLIYYRTDTPQIFIGCLFGISDS